MIERVAVLGAGSWGTALAVLLADKGLSVRLWGRIEDGVQEMQEKRENRFFLPEITFPPNLEVTFDEALALHQAEAIVFAVPAQALRGVVQRFRPLLPPGPALINTAKGIETESLLRLSEVIKQELPKNFWPYISVLSGPSHAEEVARKLPTTVVAAAPHSALAEAVQDLFMTPYFRVYTNLDIVGVELGAALKNVIALSTGISDGMGYGDNTRAALMTRGLTEIKRLGLALGAQAPTFSGLTGLGDLIVTCNSMHSRNRRAGIMLGQGCSLNEILQKIGMVVEGVETTKAASLLANRLKIEMPITHEIYQVLFSHLSPQEGVKNLMCRLKKHEVEDVARDYI